MRVSVVLLGASPRADEAIQSVLTQTRRPDELVVIDHERSPLSATRRAALRAASIPMIAVSGRPTAGALRNAAVRACHGDWIALLESEDRLSPTYIERALGVADATAATFLTTETVQTGVSDPRLAAIPVTDAESVHGATLFQRTAWDAVGGFDEDLEAFAAYDFWLRLIDRGLPGVILSEALVGQGAGDVPAGTDHNIARTALGTVLDRHRTRVSRDLADMICRRDARLERYRAGSARLNERRADAERELTDLRGKIDQATATVNGLGRRRIEFGDFERTSPISPAVGSDGGRSIGEYYISQFLHDHAADIRGRVLEVSTDSYTRQLGGDRVAQSDVVDCNSLNRRATIVGDLQNARSIASGAYDCFIMTQTLHAVFDVRAALHEAARILAPGGVLLATLTCASRVASTQGLDGDFWRFTPSAARRLFNECFPEDRVEVRTYGNVLVTIASLYGLASHELDASELETHDPYFPLIVAVRARV